MRKSMSALLLATLLLTGCAGAPVSVPSTEPVIETPEPTTEPAKSSGPLGMDYIELYDYCYGETKTISSSDVLSLTLAVHFAVEGYAEANPDKLDQTPEEYITAIRKLIDEVSVPGAKYEDLAKTMCSIVANWNK